MGKLINQSWENGKKTNFGPNFGPFGPNLTAHPQLQKKKKKKKKKKIAGFISTSS